MPYRTLQYVIAAVLATGLAAAPAQAADQATCTWTVQKLAAVAGYKQSYSYGTDHASHVFGAVSNDGTLTETPVVWSTNPATPPHVLGSAHGDPTRIAALNASGVAVGYYHDDTGRHPVRHVNGGYQDLPVPAGATGEAVDINARGDIVGTVDGSSVILWPADKPGTFTLLPKAPGDSASADGIDNARNVIGVVGRGDQLTGYVWTAAGKAVTLPVAAAGDWARPTAIRNGRVLGSEEGPGRGAAVVWDLSGHVLWRLADHGVESINADGLVSGWLSVPDGLVQQLMRAGKVVAPVPTEFRPAGNRSALTDGGLLAGSVDQQVATARCR
ncbi:hypothetical protein [Kutzneria buriramensis]|uniref:HAF family extracellular repeat protein n=1 Tax=Kutzneria buriramensis TaxID=1045776 RepID=A0A3E0HPP2_9PSEU|nr:hypothetical protein [Kutzneria buriramensis]REH48250.1 hypothetical protein BCF44_105108 [Kutzneria buriramensis]